MAGPSSPTVTPEAVGQILGIIATDDRGLVSSYSPTLPELGLDATAETRGVSDEQIITHDLQF